MAPTERPTHLPCPARAVAPLLTLALLLTACGSESSVDAHDDAGAVDDTPVQTELVIEPCEQPHAPVLFVHGGFGSGDQFTLQAQRLASNGYCESHIRTFDYDSQTNTGMATAATITRLDAAVDSLLEDTGAERLHMLGHSNGCSIARDYLEDAEHSAKVEKYVNVAGAEWAFPDDTEVLGLTSEGDQIIGRVEYEGADNPAMPVLDHIAILTAVEPFEAIHEFFTGEAPETTRVVESDVRHVSGFVMNFAENVARVDTTIDVWPVDAETGERIGDEPTVSLVTEEGGAFGPFAAEADTYYEFFIPDGSEMDMPLHVYVEPFKRSMHLLYLKTMPAPLTAAGFLLSGIAPPTTDATGGIIQHTDRAIDKAIDSLTVDGVEAAIDGVADVESTTVAIFFADGNENGVTDATPLSQLSIAPFLKGIDVFIPSDEDTPLVFDLNGQRIATPRWATDPEGTITVLFASE